MLLCLALLGFAMGETAAFAQESSIFELLSSQTKKKKKKKKKRKAKRRAKQPEKAAEEPKKERSVVKAIDPTEEEREAEEEKKSEDDEIAPDAPPPLTPEQLEEKRVEDAKRKLEAERRKDSTVTPGTASRWSNRGAMIPVASPVPVIAALPERAVPIEGTIETPGQSLLGGGQEEILSARLSLSYYHINTMSQDQVFQQATFVLGQNTTTVLLQDQDRDIDFLRARATLGYDHIAGSDFSVRLDVEYRPQINGTRFTDYRLNEAYASYGLTEFRDRDGPWWGIALGRLAIREAGYAQADGLAARFRIVDWLRAGVFGGVTGNPYGYNWNLRTTEVFSVDYYTGGAFLSFQIPELIVNVAGVLTYANVAINASGIDRAYVYVDGAWLIMPELNFVVNGWLDVVSGGQVVQNVHGSLNWAPFDELSLSLGGGRFSTVLYGVSADPLRCKDVQNLNALGCSYVADGDNAYVFADETTRVIYANDNTPIVPFDAVLMTSVYNTVWLRGAYSILRDLEVTAKFDTVIREASVNRDALIAETQSTVQPSALRMVPGVGLRYRNPDIVDARVAGAYIIDDQSQANALVSATVGRGLFGLYLSGDVRYYFGDIGGLDTGVHLSYTFPRDWFPGALSVRGTFRFFRENVALFVPTPSVDPLVPARDPMNPANVPDWEVIEKQDSILGYAGIEWRL
jgi:hypothetical protein